MIATTIAERKTQVESGSPVGDAHRLGGCIVGSSSARFWVSPGQPGSVRR
jgi:hypothetical protein